MGMRLKSRRKGGRGSTKYSFDAAAIGQTVGLSTERIRQLIRKGVLEPGDLASLARFVEEQLGTRDALVARAVIAAGGDVEKAAAELKVSRSTLYRRAGAASRSTG